MLAQGAAVDDIADHVPSAHLLDAQLDQAIGQQNAVPAMYFARQLLEGGAYAGGVAQDAGRGNHESLSGS